MKNVTLKIALATQDEFFCEANEQRPSFVAITEFQTKDYESKADFLNAIKTAKEAAKIKTGCYLHTIYLNVSPCPNGPFFPTGGINWAERAWQFHEYLNGESNSDLRAGDRVLYVNRTGDQLEKNIFGFDDEGDAILDWGCWWVSIPCGWLKKLGA